MKEPMNEPHMLMVSLTGSHVQMPLPCESRESAIRMVENAIEKGHLTHKTENRLGYYLIGPGTSFLILPVREYEELLRNAREQAQAQESGRILVPRA